MHFPMGWVKCNDFSYKRKSFITTLHKVNLNVNYIKERILLIVQINFISWNFITSLHFSLLTVMNDKWKDNQKSTEMVSPLKEWTWPTFLSLITMSALAETNPKERVLNSPNSDINRRRSFITSTQLSCSTSCHEMLRMQIWEGFRRALDHTIEQSILVN